MDIGWDHVKSRAEFYRVNKKNVMIVILIPTLLQKMQGHNWLLRIPNSKRGVVEQIPSALKHIGCFPSLIRPFSQGFIYKLVPPFDS